MLNSGGSGEEDVEVGLFRGPELSDVSPEPEQACRVVGSSSGFIFFVRGGKTEQSVIGGFWISGLPTF